MSETMTILFAFLHHLAAFVLVAALAVEFALLRTDLTPATMRRIARADMVIGLCAIAILAIGFLRVFHFEKGPGYYLLNWAFLAKISAFVLVAVLSIYPTIQ